MSQNSKIKRNDACPCGSGRKYKNCCEREFDWNHFLRNGGDARERLSIRGRNIYFANRITAALQLDKLGKVRNLKEYKAAFTSDAVRRIHEAIIEIWPPTLDIVSVLEKSKSDVSGLYVGDYEPEYLSRGIVRHSVYANKILIIDPFVYPQSVNDEYNPLLNPDQYRAQTLKNVNFWFALLPWIEEGIVEIIRTPADFDRKLNWDSLKYQEKKIEQNKELQEARDISVQQLKKRHMEKQAYQHLLLGAPDSHIRKTFKEAGLGNDGYTVEQFLEHIHAQRDRDPNFLEPVGPNSASGQLHMMSTGANYEIARLTASLTHSYLVTDIYVRWREIELDRQSHSAENKAWAPFAKALQDAPLKYLNEMSLETALILRKEGRLESFRGFLRRAWKDACVEDPFDEVNAQFLAEELLERVREAEIEWDQIDKDLIKIIGAELCAGLLTAGPLIASGHAAFLAAAAVSAGAATLAVSTKQRRQFPDRFPAAFFMNLSDDA